MKATVPNLTAARATVARVDVARVAIGPITVGQLRLRNAAIAIRAGQALLDNVSVALTLRISLVWRIHIGFGPFPDFDEGATNLLGTLTIPFNMGDAEIPSLRNINLNIAQLVGSNVQTQADPITNLRVNNIVAEGIAAADTVVPVAGFTLSGIGLSSLAVDGAAVPAASIETATVRRVTGAPLALGALTLRGLSLPQAAASDISAANIDVPVRRRDPFNFGDLNLGFFNAHLRIDASASAHIDRLRMSTVTVGASVGIIELQNVTLPYEALGITLGDIGIQTIDIPTLGVA